VIPTDNPSVAFADIDAAILVGAMPRREGMERKDLLQANVKIFESQGKALDQYAKKTVKVYSIVQWGLWHTFSSLKPVSTIGILFAQACILRKTNGDFLAFSRAITPE